MKNERKFKPGNVKRAPIDPHQSAMKNLRTSFDAGPLKINF